MKLLRKKYVLRGLSSIMLATTIMASFLTSLALENSGQVNVFLGTNPPSQNVTDDTNYYPSQFANVTEMRAAEKLHDIQMQEEGSVLLRNEGAALPLKQNPRVTLFGKTAADPIYRGGSGGSALSTPKNLHNAFVEKGIVINETIYNALLTSPIKRSRGFIGEVPGTFYTNELQSSYASDYQDAAIIVLGRYGGEQQDMGAGGDSNADNVVNADGDPIDNQGVPMLSLHQEERDVLSLVQNSNKFDKIIVILNSGYPMDIDEIDDYGVDSILWIGYPGYTGFDGVAKIIVGDSEPSGRTVDTYATNSLSSPAMRNYGGFNWSNHTIDGQNKYLIYAEGVYLGYKYYETRYQDQVLNQHNALSTKGIYANTVTWDYAAEMAYTFGSGRSYANFTQTLVAADWNQTTHQVEVTVRVSHEGLPVGSLYQGKSKNVVQLYVQLPYESGQAQKSAIQLIGYGKSKALAQGETDDVVITVDDYVFATYDNKAVNGADNTKLGCYVFDPGNYYFAIGNNAHDALNNILAKRNVSGLFDEEGLSVSGDSNKVYLENLATLDNLTHATSQTGEVVSNQFDDMDINYFIEDAVTYLNRDDWNTYPIRFENLTATDEMKTILSGNYYTKPADAPNVTSFKHSQPVTKKFIEMKDVAFDDDDAWDEFIDQLTPSELAKIVGEKFGNSAITSVGSPANANADGPDGIQANPNFSHVATIVATSSFNDELLETRGKFIAEDGKYSGQHGVYGFGANMHRTPYGGRNFEYYSEDMTLSYLASAIQTKAAQEEGLITFVKHFCANDQEVWRNGSSAMMTEQAFRQGPLRGFEGAFTKGGSLGTMTSNARCGLKVTSMSKEIMTQVLRNEWGFKGLSMTDSSKGSRYYIYTLESLEAGTDQFNNDDTRGDEMKNFMIRDRDGNMWQRARIIAKRYFYTYVHSFVINGLSPEVEVTNFVPWWETTIYSIDIALASITLVTIVLMGAALIVEKKKEA